MIGCSWWRDDSSKRLIILGIGGGGGIIRTTTGSNGGRRYTLPKRNVLTHVMIDWHPGGGKVLQRRKSWFSR